MPAFRYQPVFGILTFLFWNCSGTTQEDSSLSFAGKGEKLVEKYCTSCHSGVVPGLLDKVTWKERVLPAMAPYLGIEVFHGSQYYPGAASVISLEDWNLLQAYFDSLAPIQLPAAVVPVALQEDTDLFTVEKPSASVNGFATTTMVHFDAVTGHIFTSERDAPGLSEWSADLKLLSCKPLGSPVVDFDRNADNEVILTEIGEMRAIDVPNGNLVRWNNDTPENQIVSGLRRPVDTQSADFNKDGLTDYVVCSFGHNAGGLYLVEQLPDGQFRYKPIRETAGALQAVIHDFNGDGWMDIMALFAHGDEGIWLFTNNQHGNFIEKKIVGFPPVYGSSSFTLADINQDGQIDIVYTCGDNSDYSRILKPYHGVYVYLNEGNFSFKASYFYPVNGCTKVAVADFNHDGIPDLVTIAFFPDLENNPGESVICFQQQKGNEELFFKPIAIPVHQEGRWICMDVNDIDNDGDADIILGNFSIGFINQVGLKPFWKQDKAFIVLRNKTNP